MTNTPLIVVSIIALIAIVAYFMKKTTPNMQDCATKIKELGNKFGQSNLDSKTGRDFYNYLLG